MICRDSDCRCLPDSLYQSPGNSLRTRRFHIANERIRCPECRVDSYQVLLRDFQSPQATFMSAAVDVPETKAVSWPVAPAMRPAAPDPMRSAYQVVFIG